MARIKLEVKRKERKLARMSPKQVPVTVAPPRVGAVLEPQGARPSSEQAHAEVPMVTARAAPVVRGDDGGGGGGFIDLTLEEDDSEEDDEPLGGQPVAKEMEAVAAPPPAAAVLPPPVVLSPPAVSPTPAAELTAVVPGSVSTENQAKVVKGGHKEEKEEEKMDEPMQRMEHPVVAEEEATLLTAITSEKVTDTAMEEKGAVCSDAARVLDADDGDRESEEDEDWPMQSQGETDEQKHEDASEKKEEEVIAKAAVGSRPSVSEGGGVSTAMEVDAEDKAGENAEEEGEQEEQQHEPSPEEQAHGAMAVPLPVATAKATGESLEDGEIYEEGAVIKSPTEVKEAINLERRAALGQAGEADTGSEVGGPPRKRQKKRGRKRSKRKTEATVVVPPLLKPPQHMQQTFEGVAFDPIAHINGDNGGGNDDATDASMAPPLPPPMPPRSSSVMDPYAMIPAQHPHHRHHLHHHPVLGPHGGAAPQPPHPSFTGYGTHAYPFNDRDDQIVRVLPHETHPQAGMFPHLPPHPPSHQLDEPMLGGFRYRSVASSGPHSGREGSSSMGMPTPPTITLGPRGVKRPLSSTDTRSGKGDNEMMDLDHLRAAALRTKRKQQGATEVAATAMEPDNDDLDALRAALRQSIRSKRQEKTVPSSDGSKTMATNSSSSSSSSSSESELRNVLGAPVVPVPTAKSMARQETRSAVPESPQVRPLTALQKPVVIRFSVDELSELQLAETRARANSEDLVFNHREPSSSGVSSGSIVESRRDAETTRLSIADMKRQIAEKEAARRVTRAAGSASSSTAGSLTSSPSHRGSIVHITSSPEATTADHASARHEAEDMEIQVVASTATHTTIAGNERVKSNSTVTDDNATRSPTVSEANIDLQVPSVITQSPSDEQRTNENIKEYLAEYAACEADMAEARDQIARLDGVIASLRKQLAAVADVDTAAVDTVGDTRTVSDGDMDMEAVA